MSRLCVLQLSSPELFLFERPLNVVILSRTDSEYCYGHLDTKLIRNRDRSILRPKMGISGTCARKSEFEPERVVPNKTSSSTNNL